jgi:hypothetical protein
MAISDVTAFLANTLAKKAVRQALADLAGVPLDYVVADFSRPQSRRLGQARRLSQTVVVSYSITIPVTDFTHGSSVQTSDTDSTAGSVVQRSMASASSMQLNDAISDQVDTAVGDGVFSITVTSASPPSLSVALVATSPQLARGAAPAPQYAFVSCASTVMVPAVRNALAAVLLTFAMLQ